MKVFKNDKKLHALLEAGDFEGLKNEFLKSSLTVRDGSWALSAGNMYEYICRVLRKKGVLNQYVDVLSEHANKIFAADWNVEALLMFKDHPNHYGHLSEEGKKVVAEYNEIRKKAIEVFYDKVQNRSVPEFEEEISDGIVVKYHFGRYSFFRNGREYVIFYAED